MKTSVKTAGLLLIVLILTVSVLTGCRPKSRFEYTEDYEGIKEGLSFKKDMVFPDLSPLKFHGLNMIYRFEDAYPDGKRIHIGYVVDGGGTCSGAIVHTTFSCCETVNTKTYDNITYEGENIDCSEQNSDVARWVRYWVFLNGYRYEVVMFYDREFTLTEEEEAEVRQNIKDTLYTFICGIIDASHALEG